MLRRAGLSSPQVEILEVDGITLIPAAREVLVEGSVLEITSIEYDILEYLIRSAGRIVTREAMTTAIYHRRVTPFDRALDMHVSNLRKKLGRKGSLIRTVRGTGYLFADRVGEGGS